MSLAELGSVAEFINGAAFKPEDWGDDGRRIIRIQNLTDGSKPYNRTAREIPQKLHVHPGDLLVSWSASLGVFEWAGPDVAVLNQHIFRVVPNERKVDKRYLRYALERALAVMQRHLHGATMQHVNRDAFLATKIAIPSLVEQRRIAETMDKADALRAKRRAALAQLDALTQAIFLDMFGDPVINPKRWPTCLLEDVAKKITDGTHRTPLYVEAGIEFLSAKDLKDRGIGWGTGKFISEEEHRELVRRCNPELGDVLLAKSGSLGSVAIIDRSHEFSLFESLCLIKQDRDRIDGSFLVGLLRSPRMLAHLVGKNKGVAIKHLHLVDIRNLRIPLPPIELQHEVADRFSSVDYLKNVHRASLKSLNALFSTLQHRAFRGEL